MIGQIKYPAWMPAASIAVILKLFDASQRYFYTMCSADFYIMIETTKQKF